MICIFGGTAAYHLTPSDFGTAETLPPLETPYGPAPVFLRLDPAPESGRPVLFTSRHGAGRLARSAAFVNHRASLWAAREYGAAAVLSWNGVGAIDLGLAVGDRLVPDDLIDATRAREPSEVHLRDGDAVPGVREVFWPAGRSALLDALGQSERRGGVYVCTEGPRLETPAEIRAFARMGADVVGMTLVPEVFIAAYMGMPYASLCIVTNIAAGLAGPGSPRRFGPEVARDGLAVCMQAARGL